MNFGIQFLGGDGDWRGSAQIAVKDSGNASFAAQPVNQPFRPHFSFFTCKIDGFH